MGQGAPARDQVPQGELGTSSGCALDYYVHWRFDRPSLRTIRHVCRTFYRFMHPAIGIKPHRLLPWSKTRASALDKSSQGLQLRSARGADSGARERQRVPLTTLRAPHSSCSQASRSPIQSLAARVQGGYPTSRSFDQGSNTGQLPIHWLPPIHDQSFKHPCFYFFSVNCLCPAALLRLRASSQPSIR